MKKLRGKQIIVIAGAVVVIALAAVLGFFFWPEPKLELKLPAEWEKTRDLKARGGAFGAIYSGTGTEEDALATFRPIMEKSGWTYVRDWGGGESTSLIFRKGEQEAVVFAEGVPPNMAVFVLVVPTSQAREEEVKAPEVPKEDCPGLDIPDAPRYPGSIRINYESTPTGIFVVYIAPVDTKTVADFYAMELQAGGWMLQGMATEGNMADIVAAKTGEMITITIETDKDIAGYANVEVSLTQR